MGKISIACYRPLPGKESELREEVRTHVDILRGQGLATEKPSIAMRATDGTVLEVFEWFSEKAIEEAHTNPAVLEMWKRFEGCCTYVRLIDLPESQQMFAGFEALD